LKLPAIALLCGLLAGCASTSPEPAFRNTAAQVERQSGHRLAWDQGRDDDRKVREAVRRLLDADLSVDGAVQIAFIHNPTLLGTYEDLSLAQADLVQAGLLQNPVFSASMTTAERENLDPNLVLGVTQSFLDILLLPARKKIARTQLEAARCRLVDTVLDIAARTRAAYFTLQGALQIIEMRAQVTEAAQAAIELATRQHESGNINDLDLANETAVYEQIKLDLARSQVDAVAAREDLVKLLGVWGAEVSFKIAPRLPELPRDEVALEHLESTAIAQRADLAAAGRQVQALSYATSLARSSRWTGMIDIGADVARLQNGHIAVGPRASLELPIFDQRQAVIARLEALQRSAVRTEQAIAIDIRSDVRRSRARVVALRRFVERYRSVIVPTRENVVRLSQQQYDAMLLGVFQLLQARQTEINTYREYVETLRDYWIARSDLERAVGGRLPASASNPPERHK
jgi:cobalt-zinc-cadmium efflux system outer membrane protein